MNQLQRAPDHFLELSIHHGQRQALDSLKRFVLVLAGWQSGKTVLGPPWLLQEISKRGPGDYLIASPTYPLMTKKVLPELFRLFRQQFRLGDYTGGPKHCFTFSDKGASRLFGSVPDVPTQIFLGHAGNPDSLESATYKAAWLDEAGQKGFKLGSWEAILGRLSISQGRVLITTRPYVLGWLKQKLYDPWLAAGRNHPLIDVINFKSIDNPAFPPAEYHRAKAEMPAWKFLMAYDGQWTRPAGLIYDCFDEALHKVPRFKIPKEWPRFLGLDFGGVNTAGVFFAQEPTTKKLFAYREYKAGGRTAAEHAFAMMAGEPGIPTTVGGSKSEGQWRDEFCAAGLPVREPEITDVEVGIDRVYGAFKRNEVYVFADLAGVLDELGTYSRELDDAGEVTEKIEDKETYHALDACRYILGWLKVERAWSFGAAEPGEGSVWEDVPPGVFGR